MMISAYDGKRVYNSRYIRSISLQRGGGGATMEIVANVEGIKGNVILWETNIYDKPETEDTITRIYHRIVDMINKERP